MIGDEVETDGLSSCTSCRSTGIASNAFASPVIEREPDDEVLATGIEEATATRTATATAREARAAA